MNHPTPTLYTRLMGACLIAMFATFLPAAAAFWGTESTVPTVAGNAARLHSLRKGKPVKVL